MKADLLLEERHILAEGAFAEIVVWRLPRSAKGSKHSFKYRLALVENGVCVLRFDNETGKGDHRHIGKTETAYIFTTPEALLDDFWSAVDEWRR
jgi:hypothetical protein